MLGGQHPLPTKLKILAGNPGKRRLPPNEPEPELLAAVPEPPLFLDHYAKQEWSRVAADLQRLKLLTALDIQPLAAYCQAYSHWRTAEEAIANIGVDYPNTRGLIIKDGKGNMVPNPLVNIAAKAAQEMIRFAVEFGLTPSARARVASGLIRDGANRQSKFSGLLA